MNIRWTGRHAAAVPIVILAMCGLMPLTAPAPRAVGVDEPLESLVPTRDWRFERESSGGLYELDRGTLVGGDLYERFDFGTNLFDVDQDGTSSLEVYSSADGLDFWAAADAPFGNAANPNSLIGSVAVLHVD